jgi:DNA-binding PadR family transcriptional regulator
MSDRAFPGEFEQMVLAAVLRLGEDAWGAAILSEIEAHAGRHVSSGSLYVTIDRLERKGLVETWLGDSTPERGGRRKRYVRVTRKGLEAVAEVREALLSLWSGIEDRFEIG